MKGKCDYMRYKRFLVISSLLFLFLNVSVTVQADEENLLYFISLTSNEEIFEAYPVLDSEGYLHLFIHMINKQGYVFVHQYYNETGLQIEILEEDVQEIEIITHHLYENPYVSLLHVVYSVTSSSGGKEIKRFTWTSEQSRISSIM